MLVLVGVARTNMTFCIPFVDLGTNGNFFVFVYSEWLFTVRHVSHASQDWNFPWAILSLLAFACRLHSHLCVMAWCSWCVDSFMLYVHFFVSLSAWFFFWSFFVVILLLLLCRRRRRRPFFRQEENKGECTNSHTCTDQRSKNSWHI